MFSEGCSHLFSKDIGRQCPRKAVEHLSASSVVCRRSLPDDKNTSELQVRALHCAASLKSIQLHWSYDPTDPD